jgi:sporulation protein YqfC
MITYTFSKGGSGMDQRRKWKERLSGTLDSRGEALPLQPIMELCGDRRIWIENHRGVRKYTDQEIWVATRYGFLQIQGESLKVCRMEGSMLVITGRIRHIHIHKEG